MHRQLLIEWSSLLQARSHVQRDRNDPLWMVGDPDRRRGPATISPRANHQGLGNQLLTPAEPAVRSANGNVPVERRERLAGLLNFYYPTHEPAIDFWHTTPAPCRSGRR